MQFHAALAAVQPSGEDERHVAMSYIGDAFEEARLDGLDPVCIAQAALFTALMNFVALYGEEETAAFAAKLADRVRGGEFTASRNAH